MILKAHEPLHGELPQRWTAGRNDMPTAGKKQLFRWLGQSNPPPFVGPVEQSA